MTDIPQKFERHHSVPLLRSIKEHVKAGRITEGAWPTYNVLLLDCNYNTGVYDGCAASIADAFPGPNNHRKIKKFQRTMKSLRKHKMINYRVGDGEKGRYPILIHEHISRGGPVDGLKLNAFADNSLQDSVYEDAKERQFVIRQCAGGARAVPRQSAGTARALSLKSLKHENHIKQEVHFTGRDGDGDSQVETDVIGADEVGSEEESSTLLTPVDEDETQEPPASVPVPTRQALKTPAPISSPLKPAGTQGARGSGKSEDEPCLLLANGLLDIHDKWPPNEVDMSTLSAMADTLRPLVDSQSEDLITDIVFWLRDVTGGQAKYWRECLHESHTPGSMAKFFVKKFDTICNRYAQENRKKPQSTITPNSPDGTAYLRRAGW
jgi:hypothetical protein